MCVCASQKSQFHRQTSAVLRVTHSERKRSIATSTRVQHQERRASTRRASSDALAKGMPNLEKCARATSRAVLRVTHSRERIHEGAADSRRCSDERRCSRGVIPTAGLRLPLLVRDVSARDTGGMFPQRRLRNPRRAYARRSCGGPRGPLSLDFARGLLYCIPQRIVNPETSRQCPI